MGWVGVVGAALESWDPFFERTRLVLATWKVLQAKKKNQKKKCKGKEELLAVGSSAAVAIGRWCAWESVQWLEELFAANKHRVLEGRWWALHAGLGFGSSKRCEEWGTSRSLCGPCTHARRRPGEWRSTGQPKGRGGSWYQKQGHVACADGVTGFLGIFFARLSWIFATFPASHGTRDGIRRSPIHRYAKITCLRQRLATSKLET